jgi:serine/threonine protein kinase
LVLKNTHIKLADFGGAQIIERSTSGSLAFNSPELLLGYDARYSYDIWAFGVTLVELWSGRQPFDFDGKYTRFGADRLQLRLMELFCGDELPKECVDCVDPTTRHEIYKYGKLSATIWTRDENVLVLEVARYKAFESHLTNSH